MTVDPTPAGPKVPVLELDSIDSTNAEARRRAEAGDVGPIWITAREQTAGRGRRGRRWDMFTGNLAATLLMRTERTAADAARISFVTAVAVADTVAGFTPDSLVSLKWPNDVLLDGRKVCGILIESGRIGRTDALWLAIGIGVNVARAPTDVDRPATAIADHLREDVPRSPAASVVLDHLADAFARRLAQWDRFGWTSIADAWTARAIGIGGPCTARLDNETIDGQAEGLDEDGALRLRLADGTVRRISAGDVFFGRG